MLTLSPMIEDEKMMPSVGDDSIDGLLWSGLRWAIAAIVGGVTTLVGFFMKQTWVNSQMLSEIKHDTNNIRAMQGAQHSENTRRYDELLRRVEHLEDLRRDRERG